MNILLIGAGSKWGAFFTEYLSDQGCNIDLVTSTGIDNENVVNHKVDWNSFSLSDIDVLAANLSKEQYDLIFFNQNSGGGPNDRYFASGLDASLEGWNKSFWLDCQLPYYLIKKLQSKITEQTKIGWMLTGLINSIEEQQWKYGGYASAKTTNLHIMRSFSQYNTGIYFCLQPIWFPPGEEMIDCENIFKVIKNITKNDNGKVFLKNSQEWEYFKKIR